MLIHNSRNKKWLISYSLKASLVSIFLIILGLLWLDPLIAIYFKQPSRELFFKFNREITNIGYSIHYFILALVLFVLAHFFNHKIALLKNNPSLQLKFKEWAKFIFLNLIFVGILVQILKFIFGRQRPHLTDDFQNLNFDFFNMHWHWHSFPSGHTQVIFTMASIAYLNWPNKKWLILSLACFFGFTRVVIHQHYFSDFIAGALVGHLTTLWIYYKWPPKSLN